MKVNLPKNASIETQEQNLLLKVIEGSLEEMSNKEKEEFLKSLDLKTINLTTPVIMAAVQGAIIGGAAGGSNWGKDKSFYRNPDINTPSTAYSSSDWTEKTISEVDNAAVKTFERLGIPEAEKKALAGAGAQYESDVVYHNLKKEWEDQGVIFLDCDEALKQHEDLVKKYFMTSCVPVTLHKFSALHVH